MYKTYPFVNMSKGLQQFELNLLLNASHPLFVLSGLSLRLPWSGPPNQLSWLAPQHRHLAQRSLARTLDSNRNQ